MLKITLPLPFGKLEFGSTYSRVVKDADGVRSVTVSGETPLEVATTTREIIAELGGENTVGPLERRFNIELSHKIQEKN